MPIIGLDIGLTYIDDTSGVATLNGGLVLGHTFADRRSRYSLMQQPAQIDLLAIDGPVLAGPTVNYAVRACEKIMIWHPFHDRCKPGDSSVPGTGQALRRSGCDTAEQFESIVLTNVALVFPRLIKDKAIVEAFPNGFLGVMLPDTCFTAMPKLERGEKFDWLYEKFIASAAFPSLQAILNGAPAALWAAVVANGQHDERAALICLLTALCVSHQKYVAFGDTTGGYFFMPPWELWHSWAKTAFRANVNRAQLALGAPVDIWRDGITVALNALP